MSTNCDEQAGAATAVRQCLDVGVERVEAAVAWSIRARGGRRFSPGLE
jgi:hypothetical protein